MQLFSEWLVAHWALGQIEQRAQTALGANDELRLAIVAKRIADVTIHGMSFPVACILSKGADAVHENG